jgi:hypothetical protein
MINNKPFFARPRNAQVGQNLPPASPNYVGLQGYDINALLAALAACGPACAPNGANPAVAQMAAAAAQPQRCRRTLLGLNKFAVAASSAGSGSTQPDQWPFRGLRLIVPTDISASGDLTGLLVGQESQIAKASNVAAGGSSGIPLRVFDQTSQDSGFIDMDWCPTTTNIKVEVMNKFAAPFPFFEGALEGLQLLA